MKSFKIIVCIILVCSLFAGCTNNNHLNNLAIVEGMGIDNEGPEVRVSVQTLNVTVNSSAQNLKGNITLNSEGVGDSVFDAVNEISKTVSKEIFFGQNKLIIFGRKTAEENFTQKLDYFLRSPEARPDVAVCLSETTAKDIIESKENDALVPCENILKLIKKSESAGFCAYIDANEILNLYRDKTSDIYMPVIERKDKKKSVSVKGIGLFSKNKLKYVTNDRESMGFLLINGKIKNANIEIEDKKLGKIGINITKTNVKNKVKIKDGRVNFISDITAEIIINEIEKGVSNQIKEEKLEKVKQLVEKKLNSLCIAAFEACRNNGSDSLRVGEYLAMSSPESYNLLKNDWDYYFKTVNYSVKSKANLKKVTDNTQVD